MAASVDETFLDQMIAIQRKSIAGYRLRAALLIAVGIVFPIVAFTVDFVFANKVVPGSLKAVSTLAGAFVASISAVQCKESFRCRDRMAAFEMLKDRINQLKNTKGRDAAAERKKIKEMLLRLIEKTALG